MRILLHWTAVGLLFKSSAGRKKKWAQGWIIGDMKRSFRPISETTIGNASFSRGMCFANFCVIPLFASYLFQALSALLVRARFH